MTNEIEVRAVLKVPGQPDKPQVIALPRAVAKRMGLVAEVLS